MLTTIIRCNHCAHRGALRSYTITQIHGAQRVTMNVIARNGREAVATLRAMDTAATINQGVA